MSEGPVVIISRSAFWDRISHHVPMDRDKCKAPGVSWLVCLVQLGCHSCQARNVATALFS